MAENGVYRHFKGNLYRVIATARHSESEEWLVIYQPLSGESGYWARPASQFNERVTRDGQTMARFTRLADSDVTP